MNDLPKKAASPATLFLQRRDAWIRSVVESDVSLVARVVGVHLAMRMSAKNPGCWPNVKTVARSLNVSARHAQRGMLELEEIGALAVTRTVGKGNYYTLRLASDP